MMTEKATERLNTRTKHIVNLCESVEIAREALDKHFKSDDGDFVTYLYDTAVAVAAERDELASIAGEMAGALEAQQAARFKSDMSGFEADDAIKAALSRYTAFMEGKG